MFLGYLQLGSTQVKGLEQGQLFFSAPFSIFSLLGSNNMDANSAWYCHKRLSNFFSLLFSEWIISMALSSVLLTLSSAASNFLPFVEFFHFGWISLLEFPFGSFSVFIYVMRFPISSLIKTIFSFKSLNIFIIAALKSLIIPTPGAPQSLFC